ncbi:toprim domain-containing protein [Flavobacterium psychrophilum]|uniref:toprim domain-containing protein n=1 Tax=Flavobacterium psychrophilum TaxID=96345 RepID=UPI001D0667CA|nr:toprim domain-containing protein [Flavobacterium psychrophilum]MCB6000073.1 toprim domain-containing protein [Flavobacterium psychrophilum]MCB6014962.1 toprim domain-containing protein [Flavobacterium psychrophilum]MCB6022329.1 toprim domain-containing protein [Flavobacterium psychrophilum]MCB6032222.1 toprim domain-containing protein [Flavobacterium psychrophilum]MCB6037397.1 toprim domain-containing protein [Flavobacterium psychrophilum]
MNTAKARDISIEKVLQNLGCEPVKTNGDDLFFLSPLRQEKTPSFKINRKLNKWFDHGEQIGGNVIDFCIAKFGFNVSEALDYLKKFDDFSFFQKQIFEPETEQEKSYQIEKIIPVTHLALIQYLKSRGITNYEKISNLKEIHYSIKEKKYFALGFRNDSGGFEIRSKYAKICLGKKDISHIKNDSKTLRIFEGFFDYLSFQEQIKINENSNFLILNSVALLQKNLSILENYDTELYLDNDEAGDKYTNIVLDNFENAIDCRAIFKDYKDYSEWFSLMQLEVS